MADYNPTTWVDRSVEKPRTYTEVNNGDGTVTINPSPGTIYAAGTPVNAANMNKIEQGIKASVPKEWILSDSANLNTIIQSGFYRISGSPINAPLDVEFGQLFVAHGGNDTIFQIATGYNEGPLYYRNGNPPEIGGVGTWSSWRTLISDVGGQVIYGDLTVEGLSANGAITPGTTSGTISSNTAAVGNLEVRSSTGTDAAFMSFHRQGTYAIHFGLDTDNKIKVGGWSSGTNAYALWDERYLRNNSGVLELNVGGTWTPVGGIKSKQSGVTASSEGTTNVTITSVNPDKAKVSLLTVAANGGSVVSNLYIRLTSATNLEIVNLALNGISVSWEVIESY